MNKRFQVTDPRRYCYYFHIFIYHRINNLNLFIKKMNKILRIVNNFLLSLHYNDIFKFI